MKKIDLIMFVSTLCAIVLNSLFMAMHLHSDLVYIVLSDVSIMAIGINVWILYNAILSKRRVGAIHVGIGPMGTDDGRKLIAAYHVYKITGKCFEELPDAVIDKAIHYEALLNDELNELILFASSHGWVSSRGDIGGEYRRSIIKHTIG